MRALYLMLALALASAPFAAADDSSQKLAAGELRATGSSPQLPIRPHLGPKKSLENYRVAAEEFSIVLGAPIVAKKTIQRDVHFSSAVKTQWPEIHGTYYQPRGLKAKAPAAVVVHHLGGSVEAEKILAKHFATNGVAAVFIYMPNYGPRQIKGTKQGFLQSQKPELAFKTFQQAVLDVIRAADFLRSRPEVDPSRVGAVGVSLGAFVTAVARGVDPRLRRTVLVMAGGGLADMFLNMPEAKELLSHTKLDLAQLPKILHPVDPLTFAERVHPSDVLMLNAKRDELVPTESTLRLQRALGGPRLIWFDCGHYGLALHIGKVMNLALDHLKGRDPL